eukprot:TRINITY_DN69764_c0_g1_i1.p1 TRINITY_DN69764_c0_g1~~TRINITY_DN69764_c0_g1_i1.p1  ORF type:complete len:286 (+),score=10.51 TRINITY_DN69764_c0_g1_i1:52-909(+)
MLLVLLVVFPTVISQQYVLPMSDPTNSQRWVPYQPLTDEFNGNTLNATKWFAHEPLPTDLGAPPGWHTPENVHVYGGYLHLEAKHQIDPRDHKWNISTSSIGGKTRLLYGYLELRIRPGRSKTASNLWLTTSGGKPGEWSTEIDVFEITGAESPPEPIGYANSLPSHTHILRSPYTHAKLPKACDCTFRGHDCLVEHYHNFTGVVLSDYFHVVGFHWSDKVIEVFVNGSLVFSHPNPCIHQELVVILDRDVQPPWFGVPTPKWLPDAYRVDYIRAWKRGPKKQPQ